MRINLRAKIKNYTLFFMLSKTQRLEGINSKVIGEKDKHYIFWDLENCTRKQALETLIKVQEKFKLGIIFLVSDYSKPYKTYRAYCFSKRPLKELLHILLHTNYVDYNFFYWTVQRGYATLRTSKKEGRQLQQVKVILMGYEKTYMPQSIIKVIYDTGNQKRGIVKQFAV